MRRHLVSICCWLISTIGGSCQLPAIPDEGDLPAWIRWSIESWRADLDQALTRLKAAIRKGEQAKVFSPAQAEQQRILFSDLASDDQTNRAQRVQDFSLRVKIPAFVPLQQGWEEVTRATLRVEAGVLTLRDISKAAVEDEIERCAHEAHAPEDLDRLTRLVVAHRQLLDFTGLSRDWLWVEAGAFEQISQSMRAALEARKKGKEAQVLVALNQLTMETFSPPHVGTPRTGPAPRLSTPRKASHRKINDIFREHMSQKQRGEMEQARNLVEKALRAGRPYVECELLIRALEERIQKMVEVCGGTPGDVSGPRRYRPGELIKAYQLTANHLKARSDTSDFYYHDHSLALPVTGWVAMTPEFAVFLNGLHQDRTVRVRSQSSEKPEEGALYVAEAGGRIRDEIRARLAQVKTPRDLRRVADEIEGPSENRTRRIELAAREGWSTLKQDLLILANWWTDPIGCSAPPPPGTQAAYFLTSVKPIYDRALADHLVAYHSMSELREEEFRDLYPAAAVEKLVEQAMEREDWARAEQIFEAWRGLTAPAELLTLEARQAALRSYLVAENLEKAGFYSEAALRYQEVLKQGMNDRLLKSAGRRLQALQKDHPSLLGGQKR